MWPLVSSQEIESVGDTVWEFSPPVNKPPDILRTFFLKYSDCCPNETDLQMRTQSWLPNWQSKKEPKLTADLSDTNKVMSHRNKLSTQGTQKSFFHSYFDRPAVSVKKPS